MECNTSGGRHSKNILHVRVGGNVPPGALAPGSAIGFEGVAADKAFGAPAAAPDHALGHDSVDGEGGNDEPMGDADGELVDLAPDHVDAAVNDVLAPDIE
eukprot:TRINITY_DN13999_c0_g1_i1.p4 TRINITY_DN13999_c0_g1~~TRINITY_DN13999_c0_g1_i1.p4  ORF type:complete len:100 (-),score=17.68 TRINITY_DN13999_c0_g1_i1:91-390(-)